MSAHRSSVAWAIVAFSTSACSLLYDLSPDQCKTKGDCLAKGSDFEGTECVEGMCVPQGVAATECEVNEDCSLEVEGQWSICKSGECVSLADGSNGECRVVIGTGEDDSRYLQWASPAPIVIGGYANTASGNPFGNFSVPNYELALLEYNRVAPQKVVMVVCNGLAEDLGPSLDHLVGRLEVPAIVAGVYSANLEQMLSELDRIGQSVFLMNPLEADRSIEDSGLDERELVWHIVGTSAGLSPIYQPLLDALAAASVSEREGTEFADEELRISIVEARPELTALSGAVRNGTTVDGETLTSRINTGAAQLLLVTATGGTPAPEQADVVKELMDFAPHVVISMATNEFTPLMQELEAQWATGTPEGFPRPYYIASPYQYNDPSLIEMADNPLYAVQRRIIGVNHAPAGDAAKALYDAYLTNLEAEYATAAGGLDLAGTENFYDATWYTLYALAATSNPTGPRVVEGMKRLIDGITEYSIFDPERTGNGVTDVLSALSVPSAHIRLNGTMGPPDFDSFGVKKTVPSAYCIGENEDGETIFMENAYGYDEESKALIENIACIPGS
jgi:hypothetical protein